MSFDAPGGEHSIWSNDPALPIHPAPQPEKVKHFFIVCNICRRDMVGVRYCCLECPTYDECEVCEAKPLQEKVHSRENPEHSLIKVPDSCISDFAKRRDVTYRQGGIAVAAMLSSRSGRDATS